MAAIHAALLAVGATESTTILAAQDLYGATRTLLTDLMRHQGVDVHFVDAADTAAVQAACSRLQPTALLVETISNPLLKLADLPALADAAHSAGARLLVDSTFSTPMLLRPLALGADVVIHSATKYLAGHGDVLGGVIVTSKEIRDRAFQILKLTGANLSPHDAWLALRGMRTLALRMREHCANALQLARWLEAHPRVSAVHYPGLPSHPQHDLAQRLFADRGFGGIVSFEIADAARSDVFRFFEALQLTVPGTTLGDVHTLLLYPAHASHRTLSPEERAAVGITDALVRVSVGIESIEDISADLDQALSATRP
jgi:cystathionine gamma-synthase/methionine-gamma-lyase